MKNYDHLISINQDTQELSIFRLFDDGSKELFTKERLPNHAEKDALDIFIKLLGENILIDSPVARDLLKL